MNYVYVTDEQHELLGLCMVSAWHAWVILLLGSLILVVT